MYSATCLRRLPYIWRHLRQRNSVDKTETYVTRQHDILTGEWQCQAFVSNLVHLENIVLKFCPKNYKNMYYSYRK